MSQFDDNTAAPANQASSSITVGSFLSMLRANLDNPVVSAHAFRDFVSSTLPYVEGAPAPAANPLLRTHAHHIGMQAAPNASQFADRPAAGGQMGDH